VLGVEASKKEKSPAKKNAPRPAAVAPPPAPAKAASAPETATGPVKDYAATRSASGTKTDTPLVEVPQSISVVGAEQIRDQGSQNLGDALRYSPGIVSAAFGLDTRGDFAIARGIKASYFLDGMRTSYGFVANTATAEPYAFERVELLRGPSSMLFGQSSSGGMVNMISKRPQETPHAEVGFDFGSYNFKQTKIDFGGPVTTDSKWLYRVVGLVRDADTQVDYVQNDRLFIAPSLTFKPSRSTSVTLLGTLIDDKGGSVQQSLPHFGTLYPNVLGQKIPVSRFVGEPSDYNNTNQRSATLIADHKFSDALSIHHATRFTRTDNTSHWHFLGTLSSSLMRTINAAVRAPLFNPATAPFLDANQQEVARALLLRETGTDVVTTDTNMTGKFFAGDALHKVTAGVDYTRYNTSGASSPLLVDNLSPLGQKPFNLYKPTYGRNAFYYSFGSFKAVPAGNIPMDARPEETQAQTGAYVQDEVKLGQWSAVLGLRKDWLNIAQTGRADDNVSELTGRASLMYHFASGLKPYVSFSQAFAAQTGSLVVDDPAKPVNPRPAQPLRGDQIEAGVKYQQPGSSLLVSAAVFQLTEKNRLLSDTLSTYDQQGTEARVRGFEIEMVGKVSQDVKVVAAYSYSDAVYTAHINSFEVGTRLEGVPRHLASLWGIYSPTYGALQGWSLGAGVRYTGSTEDYGQLLSGSLGTVKTPSFTLFDAMLAYDEKHWRWQIVGQNLADTYHLVTCTTRGDCGVGQARTIISSLTYRF